MKISRFVTELFQENCYVVWDEESRQAAIIDPGMMKDGERQSVDDFIANNSLTLNYILLTHMHVDHVASAQYISTKYGCEIYAHNLDSDLGNILPLQVKAFHLKLNLTPLVANKYVTDGDRLQLAGETIEVLHTPGHSPGGVTYYFAQSCAAFTGDSVFNGSIGRTDLWGGDYDQLISAIRNKILTLPGDTVLYPGHGPSTTADDERQYNMYLR
ncbi:MAG: MBL fold metallo-hydrolase [Muribaculaceae bacterium]